MTSASAQLCDDPEFIDSRRKFNRQLFELCIECGDFFLQSGDDEATVRWLLVAAQTADRLGCDQLAAPRLESMLMNIASRLDCGRLESPPPHERRRWLHVLSVASPVGGHTALLRRWIELDNSGDQHHVVLTFMDDLAIPELNAAVERNGGTVTLLGRERSFIERSRRLREIAWRDADRVVIHSHMWDVVPTVAFGIPGGPPVLLLNHADHTFWVGAAITDLLVNLRQSGEDLAKRHRGIDRNFLFRIPLPEPMDPQSALKARVDVRTRLNIPESSIVFLTVGSAYKYSVAGELNFPAMAQKLLAELPNAYMIAVGPEADRGGWEEAIIASLPRLIVLGEQRDAPRFHPAADIYLEGFPFDSHTALLEAAVSGLPAVRIPKSAIPIFSENHFPLSTLEQPEDVHDYLRQAVALALSAHRRATTAAGLHRAVVDLQCGVNWRARLEELRACSDISHSVHQVQSTDESSDSCRFWTGFKMRAHPTDPLLFVLRLAEGYQLDSHPYFKSKGGSGARGFHGVPKRKVASTIRSRLRAIARWRHLWRRLASMLSTELAGGKKSTKNAK